LPKKSWKVFPVFVFGHLFCPKSKRERKCWEKEIGAFFEKRDLELIDVVNEFLKKNVLA
jgi:hypothetical protein